MARQAEGEAEGEASPSLEEKAEKEAGNFPARCTPPPPLCDLGKGTVETFPSSGRSRIFTTSSCSKRRI